MHETHRPHWSDAHTLPHAKPTSHRTHTYTHKHASTCTHIVMCIVTSTSTICDDGTRTVLRYCARRRRVVEHVFQNQVGTSIILVPFPVATAITGRHHPPTRKPYHPSRHITPATRGATTRARATVPNAVTSQRCCGPCVDNSKIAGAAPRAPHHLRTTLCRARRNAASCGNIAVHIQQVDTRCMAVVAAPRARQTASRDGDQSSRTAILRGRGTAMSPLLTSPLTTSSSLATTLAASIYL